VTDPDPAPQQQPPPTPPEVCEADRPAASARPLPVGAMLGAMAMVGAALGVLSAVLALLDRDLGIGVGAGAGAGLAGVVAGWACILPWRARSAEKWPFLLLGAQMVSVLGVIVATALLYFAARPSKVPLGVAAVGTFILSWIVLTRVYAARLAPPAGHHDR